MEQAKLWLPKLLAGIVAIVLVLALFNIIKAFLPTPSPEVVEDLNYGLATKIFYDEEEGIDYTAEVASDFSGSLYFDSLALPDPEDTTQAEDATKAANLYRYDFDAALTMPLIEIGESYDGNPLNSDTIAFVTSLLDEQENPTKAHVSMNTITGEFFELAESYAGEAFELALGEQGAGRAVYVFRNDVAEDVYAIENYSLFFDNPYIEQTITIDAAVSPAWAMAGDLLLFLKRDGIYAYDMRLNTTILLSETYSGFGASDRLSVSASSTFAVLTIPSLNTIAVFEPLTAEGGDIIGIEETGRIQTDGVVYTSPVISPDNRFYAVVASTRTENGNDRIIEIRHHLSRDVIETIIPEGINSEYLNLSSWSELQVNPLVLPSENKTITTELD